MISRYFLLVVCLVVVNLGVYAQSLTSAFSPAVGNNFTDAYTDTTITTAAAGSGGTGQTWDFSGYTLTASAPNNYVDPASTPYASYFPTANVAQSYSNDSGFTYYLSTSASLTTLGGVNVTKNGSTTVTLVNTFSGFTINYPLNYNTVQTYTYTGISIAMPSGPKTDTTYADTTYTTATDSLIIDGAGTLITPYGDTLLNVVRLKLIEHSRDSTDISWTFGMPAGTYYTAQYGYEAGYAYTANNGALASVSISISSDSSYTDSLGVKVWTPSYTSSELDYFIPGSTATAITNAIAVYPNPSSGAVTVNLNGAACNAAQLTDITGKEVLSSTNGTITISGQTATMNVAGLSKGIYLVQLTGGAAPATQKLVVE